MKSMKVRHGLFLLSLVMFFGLILSGCGSKDSIVGRWDFEEANWDYSWIEFFEDGAYADSWGNPRTYKSPADGQIMITSALDGFTFVWNYEIDGDTIIIIDDDGEEVQGKRIK